MADKTSITLGAFDKNFEEKIADWRDTFMRHMNLKHGDNLKNFMIAQENEYDDLVGSQVRFRIEAVLIRR